MSNITIALDGLATVTMVVNGSPIVIELNGNDAPLTAGNFVDLIDRGVYDNTVFHRVVTEPTPFVAQGGDPQSQDPDFPIDSLGSGGFIDPVTGLRREIPLEIKPVGAEQPVYGQTLDLGQDPILSHTKGAIAMARADAPDSASSQFYFALDDLPGLDGNYAVFGYVQEGIEVVEEIERGDRIESVEINAIGRMVIDGSREGDGIRGTSANDLISGGRGNDTIVGNGGDDTINGGSSDDLILGTEGRDLLIGGDGNDTLDGGSGNDILRGAEGDDLYVVDSTQDQIQREKRDGGIDTIRASLDWTINKNVENLALVDSTNLNGTGNNLDNVIVGDNGRNRLLGRSGNDTLAGNAGRDRILGGDGNDSLVGGDSNDTLTGGIGNDTLTGEAGEDTFVFNDPSEGVDQIADFIPATDVIAINTEGFGGNLSPGSLGRNQLADSESSATDQTRFIYTSRGRLFFDVDGNGSESPLELARLEGNPNLRAGDFLLL